MVDRMLGPAGQWLADAGVSANVVTLGGFVCGIGAAGSVALGWNLPAVALLLLNRLLDGLDGAVARAAGGTDLGGFLDITMDFIIYSAIRSLSRCVTRPMARQPLSDLQLRRHGIEFPCLCGHRSEARHFDREPGKKSFFHLGGLTEGTETIIFW